ncbi:endonuclease [Metamycoplasma salivarium]|uniref:Extracellular ribonuclease n=2 Tax=Metamycoplasma salivarium TaxID=2124 RepID=A0A448ZYD2_METSV|nr:endonuclease [Metamycoplasma salivarium]CAD7361061.1 Extracellular ribonuclease precursor [Metamycoplasma salivarium]VEU56257.1 Extracellular ribonuclease precursor [Metamycoplasma salivarium]
MNRKKKFMQKRYTKNLWNMFILPTISILPTFALQSCGDNNSNIDNEKYYTSIKLKNNVNLASLTKDDFIFENLDAKYEIVDFSAKYDDTNKKITIEFKIRGQISQKILKTVVEIIPYANPNKQNIIYDATNNYYASAQGLRGMLLFEELYKLQKSKTSGVGSYTDLYKTYETAFVDKYFEKNNTVLDVYSENPYGQDPYEFKFGEYDGKGGHARDNRLKGKEGWMYNREHMIPQSWFNDDQRIRCDAHFVWPTDKMVNQWRSNNPHYEITNGKTSQNGTKWNSSYCEPIDYFKGDIARAYFYFQLTYNNKGLSNNGSYVFKNVFPFFQENFLKTYQKWANNDSVDIIEIDRNNAIAKAQGGIRNPFIDYPNLPSLIWGNGTETFQNLGVAKTIK